MMLRFAVLAAGVLVGAGAAGGAGIGAAAPPREFLHESLHLQKQCAHRRQQRHGCKRLNKPPHQPTTTTTTVTSTTPAALPSRLAVDENDTPAYSLNPSHNPVAQGTVTFNVYNFGQDAHTFAVEDSASHELAFASVPAGQPQTAVTVNATLAPGTYTLLCTLPGHAALGMRASLTVQ